MGDLRITDNFADLGVDGRIIRVLRWIMKKWSGEAWTGLIWHGKETSGGLQHFLFQLMHTTLKKRRVIKTF